MAETIEKKTTNRGKPKNSTTAKKTTTSIEQVNVQPEELNLDTKVTVKSIADWTVGFARRADGYGDITISPKGSIRLSRNEIITQVQNGNKLFNGLDGKGSHATLIIEDSPTRIEVGFEDGAGNNQKVFSNELVLYLFGINSTEEFQMKFKENIRTRAEKYAVIDAIKRLEINDYSKIRFVEEYTGFRL